MLAWGRRHVTSGPPHDGVSGFASVIDPQRPAMRARSLAAAPYATHPPQRERRSLHHEASRPHPPTRYRRPSHPEPASKTRSARSPSARSARACSRACRQSCGFVSAALRRKPLAQSPGRLFFAAVRGRRANRSRTRSCDRPRRGCPPGQRRPDLHGSPGLECRD